MKFRPGQIVTISDDSPNNGRKAEILAHDKRRNEYLIRVLGTPIPMYPMYPLKESELRE